MIRLNRKQMQIFRMVGVPAIFITLACGWLIFDGFRSRSSQLSKYALPANRSGDSMIEFLRELDGAYTVKTSHLIESSNLKQVRAAVDSASRWIDNNREQLSQEQLREADYYRIYYGLAAVAAGYSDDPDADLDLLLPISKRFLSSAAKFSKREVTVAPYLLHALERTSRFTELIEFIAWVRNEMLDGPESRFALGLESKLALQRQLTAVERRVGLLRSQLDLVSTTLDGQPFRISDWRGKIVLVEFWSTTCGPCLTDFPALKRIYHAYHSQGFEVLGVCLQAPASRIANFVEANALPWDQLYHDEVEGNIALEQQFGIQALPTTLLVDAAGQVVAIGVRPLASSSEQDLEKQILKLLQSSPAS